MEQAKKLYYAFVQRASPLAFLSWEDLPSCVQEAWQDVYKLAVIEHEKVIQS